MKQTTCFDFMGRSIRITRRPPRRAPVDDSAAKTTTKKHFLVLMERHVGRHCGRDFKLPWQRRWPLGWPESTKALFFLGFLFVNCLVACSEFNLSSHGHSEKKLTRFAW